MESLLQESAADDLEAVGKFKENHREEKLRRAEEKNAEPKKSLVPFLLSVLSWGQDASHEGNNEWITVAHFQTLPPTDLRVVFAPLDNYQLETSESLVELLKLYSVPPAFLRERIQAVPYSFCRRKQHDGSELVWFHYLCKNVDTGPTLAKSSAQERSQPTHEDFSWITSAFILHVGRKQKNRGTSVTLLCFGASEQLHKRFEQLRKGHRWKQILDSPYTILSLVLDELYIRMDNVVWGLGHMFGEIETAVLDAAKPKDVASSKIPNINFVSLHNISKQSIYLLESTASFIEIIQHLKDMVAEDAAAKKAAAKKAAATAKDVTAKDATAKDASITGLPTEDELFSYHLSAVNGTRTRLFSLDRRISNLITLAFNLVTQSDSRTLKVDSKLMILIALVTMIFLPTNTIAAIFASPFFTSKFQGLDADVKQDELHMLSEFWLFWAVATPITAMIMIMSWIYWQHVKRDILESVPVKKQVPFNVLRPLRRSTRTQCSKTDGSIALSMCSTV